MTTNFWQNATHPLLMLAPMEEVTDTVFREIVLQISHEDNLHVLFTEFTSTDGMCHPIGKEKIRHRLRINQSENVLLKEKNIKLVAQLWGNNPNHFHKTIQLIQDEGYEFDGFDLNMGCPAKNVVSHGSCSALINQLQLAQEIIQAAREATSLPLSVKTRLGLKKIETERWINHLLNQPIDAIILHGRIQKQMSNGLADWNEIAKAVHLRNQLNSPIKIIGNGDVNSLSDASLKIKTHGADGAMIGRGIFKNPWLFANRTPSDIEKNERIKLLLTHLDLFDKTWKKEKNFHILRRYFKIYLSEFIGASEMRHQLMQTHAKKEVLEILK